MRLKDLRADSKQDMEGVWVTIDEADGDTPAFKLKVARMNNPNYQKALREFGPQAKYKLRGRSASMDPFELVRRATARALLLDWSGLLDDDDKDLPYSEETAFEALTCGSDLFNLVHEIAGDRDNYREEMIEEAAKNSLNASAGS